MHKSFTQHIQVEYIPNNQLGQVGEHLMTCHTGVGSENAVGIRPTDRQGTTQQMSNTALQGVRICAVVDGEINSDLWYADISHNAVTGDV